MPVRWIAAILALAALSWGGAAQPLSRSGAPAAGLTDSVDAGDPRSEAAHAVASGGRVSRGIAGDKVGGHDARRMARTLAGKGSWVSYRLRVPPSRPVTLEIEEIDNRDTSVRGYTVLVDGRPAYFRTFAGCGAGPVHYFVQLPATGRGTLTVRFVNAGAPPVHLGRIWAVSDFPRYFAAARMAVLYYLAPTVWLSWTDRAGDLARVLQVKRSLGQNPNVRPAFTTFIPYANLDDRSLAERLDYILDLSERAGMPVQIELDSWWANTPDGSDGRGGFWTDVPYQQVVYNADARRFQLSIPNQWSSTPWLTVNSPALNAMKRRRLSVAVDLLRRRALALRARGRDSLILGVNTDNEPVYWASGNAGLGDALLQADFNPAAVAAARKAGVILDPADGLSFPERRWLWRNLLGYNAMVADTIARGLDRDASLVSAGATAPAFDLLRDRLYTQAMVANPALQYPMLSAAWPFWESAAPASAKVGGEWNGDTPGEQQAIMHHIALGRAAGTNAETGNDARNNRSVVPGYALGQRYVALYNYPLDQMGVAAVGLLDASAPFPTLSWRPVLRDVSFRDASWKRQALGYRDVRTGLIGNTAAIAAYPVSGERPGVLTFRLDAPGPVWKGLFLELWGRAFHYQVADPAVHIRVLAGPTPEPSAMRELHRFHDTGEITDADPVDLSPVAKGRKTVYVRLEMHAPGLPDGMLSWCAIHRVRFTVPWDVSVAGIPQDVSLRTMRRQNLVVSWRADAERALADLAARIHHDGELAAIAPGRQAGSPSARLASARAAYARGLYADAVRLASAGLCVSLPASYEVSGPGQLSPYPIQIRAAGPLSAAIEAWDRHEMRWRMGARAATRATVRVSCLAPSAAYAISRHKDTWTLRPDRKGRFASDAAGVLILRVTAPATNAPRSPSTITGLFRGRTERPGAFGLYPDAGGNIAVLTGARTRIRRGEVGREPAPAALADLRRGDRVTVRLGPDGVATDLIAASRVLEGMVGAYQPMSALAMPAVALEGEATAHVLDLYAPLHLAGGDATVRAIPVGFALLRPGDRVRLRTDPKTGRIFELWKD